MQLNELGRESQHVIILGIRGIPAAHGGFETFAENLALYLHARGWRVTVYCQGSTTGERQTDTWCGINRIHIPTRRNGAIGTIEFDIKCTQDVLNVPGLLLTLGYNTGFLSCYLAAHRRTNCINMDGLEWKRAKYGLGARAYLWLNERLAAWSGTKLIADHPEIGKHLATRVSYDKIAVIPYGSHAIESADPYILAEYGLEPYVFCTIIARAEPENSILEMVRGFSKHKRGIKLVVLGSYRNDKAYQNAVLEAASDEVIFVGPVYEAKHLAALRFYSYIYLHGHQVGGTNPSLVEALGSGNAVLAHNNSFNRWVAGDAAKYFCSELDFTAKLEFILQDKPMRDRLSAAARLRWHSEFTWPQILAAYENLLDSLRLDGTASEPTNKDFPYLISDRSPTRQISDQHSE